MFYIYISYIVYSFSCTTLFVLKYIDHLSLFIHFQSFSVDYDFGAQHVLFRQSFEAHAVVVLKYIFSARIFSRQHILIMYLHLLLVLLLSWQTTTIRKHLLQRHPPAHLLKASRPPPFKCSFSGRSDKISSQRYDILPFYAHYIVIVI